MAMLFLSNKINNYFPISANIQSILVFPSSVQSVQFLSPVRFFAIPWTAVCQASLSITNSQSLLKLTSIESVMPSNHLILCRPPLLLPSIFPNWERVFSNESVLAIVSHCYVQSPSFFMYVFITEFQFVITMRYTYTIILS